MYEHILSNTKSTIYTYGKYDSLEISLSFWEGNWLIHQDSGGIHRMDDLSYAGLGKHTADAWMVGMSAARLKGSFLAPPEFLTNPAPVLPLMFDSVQSVKTTMLPYFWGLPRRGVAVIVDQLLLVSAVPHGGSSCHSMAPRSKTERSGCQETVPADDHAEKSLNGICSLDWSGVIQGLLEEERINCLSTPSASKHSWLSTVPCN